MISSTTLDRKLAPLAKDLAALEKTRRGYVARVSLTGAIGFAAVALAVFLWGIYALVPFILFLLFWLRDVLAIEKKYAAAYQGTVPAALVRLLAPHMAFEANAHVPQTDIEASGHITAPFSQLAGNDLLTGRMAGLNALLSDVKLSRVAGQSATPVFEGLFLVVKTNEAIAGQVLIVPTAPGMPISDQHVVFGEPGFAKEFTVQATSEDEARKLVTPDFRARLLAFQEVAEGPVTLSWVDRKLFVSINRSKEAFEPHLFSPSTMPTQIAGLVQDLQFRLGILGMLGLGQKNTKPLDPFEAGSR